MSIQLADAEAILAKLIEAQKEDPIGALGSISIAGRTVSFKTSSELIEQITFWSSVVAQLKRSAAGTPTHGRSRAVFC